MILEEIKKKNNLVLKKMCQIFKFWFEISVKN